MTQRLIVFTLTPESASQINILQAECVLVYGVCVCVCMWCAYAPVCVCALVHVSLYVCVCSNLGVLDVYTEEIRFNNLVFLHVKFLH